MALNLHQRLYKGYLVVPVTGNSSSEQRARHVSNSRIGKQTD